MQLAAEHTLRRRRDRRRSGGTRLRLERGPARAVRARGRARRRGGRRLLRRGRGHARPGDRGRLRRAGRAGARPGGSRALAGASPLGWRSRPAARPGSGRAARWWWPPTATTWRSCAACTSCTWRSGSTPNGWRPRAAGGSSRGSRRGSPAACTPPATPRPTRARPRCALAAAVDEIAFDFDVALDRARRRARDRRDRPRRHDRLRARGGGGRRVVARARPGGRRCRCGPSRARSSSCAPAPAGGEPLARIVRTPRCYLVGRGDGRVVLGATMEEQGFDTAVTAGGVHRLLEHAWEVVPETDELELERAVAGLRPGTPDNLPVIGPGDLRGLVWATGHWRNGVLLAPLTGEAVAELLAERQPARGGGRPRRGALRDRGGAGVTSVTDQRRVAPAARTARPWPQAVRESGVEPGGRGVAVAVDGEVVPRGRVGEHAAARRAGAGGAPRRAGRRRQRRSGSPAASCARAWCSAPAASATSA